jgi:hexokinase
MPASEREYSKQDFFAALAERLDTVKNLARRIGFCFSYAMAVHPDGDGEVIAFNKEIKAKEVVGSPLGAGLRAALVGRGWAPLEHIALVNDTTAALLAGAAQVAPGKAYSSYVGLILGTGLNVAYQDEAAGKRQIIVTEAGFFTKLPRSDFDATVDALTVSPGQSRLEKMAAGAYLGQVISVALQQAARDGLFSPPVAPALESLRLEMSDVDAFLYAPHRGDTLLGAILRGGDKAAANANDAALIFGILDAFVDRCARIAAVLIAASVIKGRAAMGAGADPTRPVCVVTEGTTFVRSWRLRERTAAYLDEVLWRRRALATELVTVENAVTLGAAVAGLAGGA